MEDKILIALKELDVEKASGPDGFSFKFDQSFWPIFKDELMSLFQSFHFLGEFDLRIFESFISLLPKVKISMSLNDF